MVRGKWELYAIPQLFCKSKSVLKNNVRLKRKKTASICVSNFSPSQHLPCVVATKIRCVCPKTRSRPWAGAPLAFPVPGHLGLTSEATKCRVSPQEPASYRPHQRPTGVWSGLTPPTRSGPTHQRHCYPSRGTPATPDDQVRLTSAKQQKRKCG